MKTISLQPKARVGLRKPKATAPPGTVRGQFPQLLSLSVQDCLVVAELGGLMLNPELFSCV